MTDLLLDIRYALRGLRKHPTFSGIAILTLALGIGATTAIFSVIDTLILRDLPYPRSGELVTVWQDNRREGIPRDDVAPANFIDWRERNQTFVEMAAVEPYSQDLVTDDRAEVLFAVQATEGFFDLLGVQPYLGRLFRPEDHTPGTGAVVVLAYGLWMRGFGGDSSIVGRALVLDDAPAVVVGVLPPEFETGLLAASFDRDLWIARRMQGWEQASRESSWWQVVGRLNPGVTAQQAEADLDRVAADLAVEYPRTNENIGAAVVGLHAYMVSSAGTALWLLFGAVGLVLLIACANVANLLLARGAQRETELGVRAALGAGGARLARLVLTEVVVLACLGSVVGIIVAFWGVDLIKALAPGHLITRLDAIAVDGRVLGFTLLLTALTALLFGAVPTLQLSRPNLQGALKEGRGHTSRARARVRSGLIVAETALALGLLVGAGLILRSFVMLLNEDTGFRRDRLAVLQIFRWNNDETAQHRRQYFRDAIATLEAVPGVRSAGAVSAAPFLEANIDLRRAYFVDGEPMLPAEEMPQTHLTIVTPGYFETVGVPVRRGRGLTDADDHPDAELVVVINESLRRQAWPDGDPLGRFIRLNSDTSPPLRVVGVVGDVRHAGFDAPPRPEVFVPHGHTQFGSMTFFVRTAGDPAHVLPPAREALWDLDARQTFYYTGTVGDMISRVVAPRRFVLALLGAFAVVALLMAAIGIYGVVSFAVQHRTREIGVRMALGARRADVVTLVVRQGVRLSAIGTALGLVGAIAGSRLVESMLYHVSPRDGFTLTGAAVVLLGVAAAASYLPARRAARIDPLEALRHE
ncbi:MAG TPA: ABC transporter permease [Gemmatimonadales bacterium]